MTKERKIKDRQGDKSKVLFVCLPGLQNFIADIAESLKKEYDAASVFTQYDQNMKNAIRWADVVWIEWADGLAEAVTNNPEGLLHDKKVICRMHSYEVLNGIPSPSDDLFS